MKNIITVGIYEGKKYVNLRAPGSGSADIEITHDPLLFSDAQGIF
jgi:hypothetical protein